jgi:hypothetical protein
MRNYTGTTKLLITLVFLACVLGFTTASATPPNDGVNPGHGSSETGDGFGSVQSEQADDLMQGPGYWIEVEIAPGVYALFWIHISLDPGDFISRFD